MTSHSNANVGCLLVGEYVDEAELPEKFAQLRSGSASNVEVERPRLVASYLDVGSKGDDVKEFTVLLRDNRLVRVRGHGLQYLQNASNPTDLGSYGVLLRSSEGEILVALFRVSEVTGIFSGDLRPSRESA